VLLRTIRLRVPEDCAWVFPGDAEGKPLRSRTPKSGNRFLARVMRQGQSNKRFWENVRTKADLPAVRIHDLRHAFASLLVSGGMTLPMIGNPLGHTQVQTTQRYTHLLDDPLRTGLEQLGDMLRVRPSWFLWRLPPSKAKRGRRCTPLTGVTRSQRQSRSWLQLACRYQLQRQEP
jgi:integrase